LFLLIAQKDLSSFETPTFNTNCKDLNHNLYNSNKMSGGGILYNRREVGSDHLAAASC
jgi:hypothetical protein